MEKHGRYMSPQLRLTRAQGGRIDKNRPPAATTSPRCAVVPKLRSPMPTADQAGTRGGSDLASHSKAQLRCTEYAEECSVPLQQERRRRRKKKKFNVSTDVPHTHTHTQSRSPSIQAGKNISKLYHNSISLVALVAPLHGGLGNTKAKPKSHPDVPVVLSSPLCPIGLYMHEAFKLPQFNTSLGAHRWQCWGHD